MLFWKLTVSYFWENCSNFGKNWWYLGFKFWSSRSKYFITECLSLLLRFPLLSIDFKYLSGQFFVKSTSIYFERKVTYNLYPQLKDQNHLGNSFMCLPDFRLLASFRTVENARLTRIECLLTERKNGSGSGPKRGTSGTFRSDIEKKFLITNIFILYIFFSLDFSNFNKLKQF